MPTGRNDPLITTSYFAAATSFQEAYFASYSGQRGADQFGDHEARKSRYDALQLRFEWRARPTSPC